MYVAFIRITEDRIVARDEFTKEELHHAIDGKVQLFRVDANGGVEFYDADDGCWTELEMVVTKAVELSEITVNFEEKDHDDS